MSDDQVLAGAKFYARASALRAVNGVIPDWDDQADGVNWDRTRPDVRKACLDMVRGIIVACEYRQREAEAAKRAKSILDSRR